MKKNHLLKILFSLIVKFSDVQAENYFHVKFINCYLRLREISALLKQMTLETGASLIKIMQHLVCENI